MLIVCKECNVNYTLEKMGVWTVELSDGDDRAVYRGDLYKCPSCLHEIVADFGKPLHRGNADDYVGLVSRVLQTEHVIFNVR